MNESVNGRIGTWDKSYHVDYTCFIVYSDLDENVFEQGNNS